MESGLKTDDGEELSRAELIARIIDPVSFEEVRQGGLQVDAQWRCNRARVKAAHIETLFNTRAPSDAALVEALEPFARAYERWADGGNLKGWQAERMKQSVDAHRYCVAFEALAAAKGQP